MCFFKQQSGISSLCGTQAPLLITGADDNTAQIVEFTTGKVLRVLKGHNDIVFTLDYTYAYTGSDFIPTVMVVTGSRDKTIRVFDGETSACIRVLLGHICIVRSVKILANDVILSCSGDYRMKVWKLISGECIETINCGDVCGMFVSREKLMTLVTSGIDDGKIVVWKKPPGIQVARNLMDSSQLRTWRVVQGRDMVVTSSSDSNVNSLRANPITTSTHLSMNEQQTPIQTVTV
jgi:WD40 repeat protein